MASRYAPSVRPVADDPLATALNALQSSFFEARGRRRQDAMQDEERARRQQLDRERQEDRAVAREDREHGRELQELELALRGVRRGTAPTSQEPVSGPTLGEARRAAAPDSDAFLFTPPDRSGSSEFATLQRMLRPPQRTSIMPQVDEAPIEGGIVPPEGGVDPIDVGVSALGDARQMGPGAFREPRILAAPGAFVPGVGFTPRAIYEPTPELGLQRDPMVSRPDPRFEQLTEGFYREDPDRETEELVQFLVADGVPENRARIIARNPTLLDNQLFPPQERAESATRWERFTDADGAVWQINPVTGEKRPLGLRGRVPGSDDDGPSLTPKQQRDILLESAAGDAAYMIRQPGVTVDGVVVRLQELYPDLTPGDAAGLVLQAQDRTVANTERAGEVPAPPIVQPTNRPRNRPGTSEARTTAPASSEQTTRVPLAQRIAELKAAGVDKEEARATLLREGYAVQ